MWKRVCAPTIPANPPHSSKFKPWRLLSFHGFENPETAAAFERYLKSGSGRAFAQSGCAHELRETKR